MTRRSKILLHSATCADCGHECTAKICSWNEARPDGRREITLCETCWQTRERGLLELEAA